MILKLVAGSTLKHLYEYMQKYLLDDILDPKIYTQSELGNLYEKICIIMSILKHFLLFGEFYKGNFNSSYPIKIDNLELYLNNKLIFSTDGGSVDLILKKDNKYIFKLLKLRNGSFKWERTHLELNATYLSIENDKKME